jgi:hypothetical protein
MITRELDVGTLVVSTNDMRCFFESCYAIPKGTLGLVQANTFDDDKEHYVEFSNGEGAWVSYLNMAECPSEVGDKVLTLESGTANNVKFGAGASGEVVKFTKTHKAYVQMNDIYAKSHGNYVTLLIPLNNLIKNKE